MKKDEDKDNLFDYEEHTLEESTVDGMAILRQVDESTQARIPILAVLAGAAEGTVVRMDTTRIRIGRSRGADLVVEDSGISRRHCEFEVAPDGRVTLRDLGSRNGTLVNGFLISEATKLHNGDRIQVGLGTVVRFGYLDDDETAFYARMYENAMIDVLTQAHNRRFLRERLKAEMAFARRHKTAVALILTDCDQFKRINDTYGHAAGDEVLRQFAVVVKRELREEDVFARYGGDEFALLLRGVPPEGASKLAERVRAAVATASFVYKGQSLPVTVSVGVGALEGAEIAGREVSDLLEIADASLYEAKNRGRNCVVGSDSEIKGRRVGYATVELSKIQADLANSDEGP